MPRKEIHRQERVNLYLTPEEKVRLESAADKAGLPLSSWIRLVALEAADNLAKRKSSKS